MAKLERKVLGREGRARIKPTTTVLIDAINARRRLTFEYNGKRRRVEPQCYGVGRKGTELLRAHQLEGGTEPEPLFDVSKIEKLQMLDEQFRDPGPNYRKDDSAMTIIFAQL